MTGCRLLLAILAVLSLALLGGCSKSEKEHSAKHGKRPPIIGINMDASGDDESPRLSMSSDYLDAVLKAGGIPMVLPPATDVNTIKRQVALCDGFVLTGGRDIDPAKYGEPPHEKSNPLNARRESYDFSLIKEILSHRKPFLAVCLGCQEVNVALGGSLIQDIPSETSTTINHKQTEPRSELAHSISITSPSKLAKLVDVTSMSVNSFHHQSCDKPGKGVRFTAKAPDGIIESYELDEYPFGVAVQWHPEALTTRSEHLKVYEGLVKAAKRRKR